MANKTKVAIFDFCGTCVNFQTADEYIRYATKDFLSEDKLRKSEKIIRFCAKTHLMDIYNLFFSSSLKKKLISLRIKGVKYEDADKIADAYIEDVIIPNTINKTIALFNECKENDVFTMFVSAAYDIYLNKFAKKFGFDYVIATRLVCKNGIMTGRFKDDCVGKRKKEMALKYLNKRFGKQGYEVVFSVGDSISDIPILDLAEKKVVISKTHQSWIKEEYEEIIYGD